MAILSQAEVHRMLDSTEPITLPNACHMGWTVQVLCTGTALLSERKLCVMGCCLEGHWFRPPAYFTDKMVVLVLLPESIINVPCKESVRKSWYEKWDTEFVDVYKVLVTELFSLGVSSKSTVFFGSIRRNFEHHDLAYFSDER